MYQEIKKLAEAALKLQNKNFMDETFKRIMALCDEAQGADKNSGKPVDDVAAAYWQEHFDKNAEFEAAAEKYQAGLRASLGQTRIDAESAQAAVLTTEFAGQTAALESAIEDIKSMTEPRAYVIKKPSSKKGAAK